MINQSIPRGSSDRSGLTSDEGDRCELNATAHVACGAVGLFLTLALVALTFALVVSLVQGLGVLSTTAVVLWIATLWTITWIGAEVSLLRWGTRFALPRLAGPENGDS